ncbi:apolipoprotein D-like [Phlebotomus argentipes]|uniref:apolipoprotein D-like n=1 Tax=Phlebotomus argentipes TaxID=94469 RepID=UPI002892D1B3|nr:apolipoprotein D-like [Phlebotomus argentipes]
MRFGVFLSVICLLVLWDTATGQFPSFGRCPDYAPVSDFDKERFLGMWYEQERYFTLTELGSKCTSMYFERRADQKLYANNGIVNRFTNVQRIVSGQMTLFGRGTTGKFNVRYTNTPIAYDTTFNVLDTDYDGFAVLYSCSSIIPFGHTDFVWLMTRDRLPAGEVLQRAYGTLDKYKISRTFFVETDQKDCDTVAAPQEAYDPTEPSQRSEAVEAEQPQPEEALRKDEEPAKAAPAEEIKEEKNATE